MDIGQSTVHLKNFASRPSAGPGDKLIKILRLTWGTSQNIDLTGLVRRGATVSYLISEVRTVSAAGLITIAIVSQLPQDADLVDLLILFDVSDIAPSSEYVFS